MKEVWRFTAYGGENKPMNVATDFGCGEDQAKNFQAFSTSLGLSSMLQKGKGYNMAYR